MPFPGWVVVVLLLSFHELVAGADFGHHLLPLWRLDPSYTNLNFGSFGAVPHEVTKFQEEWIRRIEANPDLFFRYDVFSSMDRVRSQLADYVSADSSDIVFVENASEGMNSVLRSMASVFPRESKVLILDLAYGMVKNVLAYLQQQHALQVVTVTVSLPPSKSAIIAAVKAALTAHDIKLVSLSHITSVPSFILPIHELILVCRQHGALVLIDGAHALGQIPINITRLSPDFYVSNGHKWLFSPKGSAFLWVKKELQPLIWPTTISGEGQGVTPFQRQFSYEGTKDYSPWLAMEAAFTFRTQFTEEKILTYIHDLAVQAAHSIANILHTDSLIDDPFMIAAMVNVRIPSQNQTLMQQLPLLLLNTTEPFKTWVPVFQLNGNWYTRISAQIFNELSDFERLAHRIKDIIQHSLHNKDK